MIAVDNLSVTIGDRSILNGVSATFPAGKITVIMGPNGAGKSTLLSALAGLQGATAGAVKCAGHSIAAMPARLRAQTIGLLPQSESIAWDLTVSEFIGLGRMPYHRFFVANPDDADKVASAMHATDTVQFADRNILSLSGGERARVLLARVIAGEPQWLLADEPLANLDLRHQLDLLDLLRAQANAGVGVIAVLHDLYHAARTADHIVLLHNGSVLAAGTPAEVLTVGNIQAAYDVACQAMILPDGSMIFVPQLHAVVD
jgi:iron complex transport system ATP-binding protein